MAMDRKPEFFKGATLRVAIIGCGYVGLPLALRFAEAGHKVVGFDTDPEKVKLLNAGKSYIEHIQQTKIQQYVNIRHFHATTEFTKLKEADAIIICVPTPLNEYREPDLSYVETTVKSIQPHLQKGQLVVLESTRIPAPPKNWSCRSWKRAACAAPLPPARKMKTCREISSWRFHRNAKIPGTSSLVSRKYPKSLAA